MKMKLIQSALRSLNGGLSHHFRSSQPRMIIRAFAAGAEANKTESVSESRDDFEQRIFGGFTGNSTNSSSSQHSFFRKIERAEKAHNNSDFGTRFNVDNRSDILDGLDESFSTLSDGMDDKLKEAATFYDFDEIDDDPDFEYRPDVNWERYGDTYDLKDLDIRKPGVWEPTKRHEFETTTAEVLRRADFRNVRFLANFITDAGIIIKRSQTKISAKAQRKVAREIKTARAFGLMPFTTMGTKHFKHGKTMENLEEDYDFETYDNNYNFVKEEASVKPL